LRGALRKANYKADDWALCHRDLTQGSANAYPQGDQCDDNLYTTDNDYNSFFSCAVSVFARARPITFINNNPEVVLCCWQLGYYPDIMMNPYTLRTSNQFELQHFLGRAEASDPFEPMDEDADDDEESDRRRKLQSTESVKPTAPRPEWPKWEPLRSKAEWAAFKAKLLEQDNHPAFAEMRAARLADQTAQGKADEARQLEASDSSSPGNADGDGSEEHTAYGGDYDCNNYWGLRRDLLDAFDHAPIGSGAEMDLFAPGNKPSLNAIEPLNNAGTDLRTRKLQTEEEVRDLQSGYHRLYQYHNNVRTPGRATCQEGNCRATKVFWPKEMYTRMENIQYSASYTNSFTSSFSQELYTFSPDMVALQKKLLYQYNNPEYSLCVDGLLHRYDMSWVMATAARSGALQCCLDQPKFLNINGASFDAGGGTLRNMDLQGGSDFDLESFIMRNMPFITERYDPSINVEGKQKDYFNGDDFFGFPYVPDRV